MGLTKGEIDFSKRRALNIFDKWNDVTGCFTKLSGYYYEIQGVIEDSVECGIQCGINKYEKLESEV